MIAHYSEMPNSGIETHVFDSGRKRIRLFGIPNSERSNMHFSLLPPAISAYSADLENSCVLSDRSPPI